MRAERAFSPAARASEVPDPSRVLVIGCGALARELVAVIDQAGLSNVDLTCLPATLHNRPGGIPTAVRAKIRDARPRYERIFIAYADCGTGGLLDALFADEGVERLPGAHCYEFYAGSAAFAAMTDEDPATFFLTDFLARNFERLVIVGLALDRHPELLPVYFGNYHRLVYLAQTDDPALIRAARRAARRLGLAFELRRTGYGDLATSVIGVARAAAQRVAEGAAGEGAAGEGPAGPGPAGPGPARPEPFAPAANNAGPDGRPEAKPGEWLQPQQRSGKGSLAGAPDLSPRATDLSPRQTPGRRGSTSRRLLHPRQRPRSVLLGEQRSGPSAAGSA